MTTSNYYVYVYIDPRNFEEFYYGKGRGSRKEAHLKDVSESTKARRIKDIKAAGEEPLIRVIARGLSESEALLVEKTLLWKLGRYTTNVATGNPVRHCRCLSLSLHLNIPNKTMTCAFGRDRA